MRGDEENQFTDPDFSFVRMSVVPRQEMKQARAHLLLFALAAMMST